MEYSSALRNYIVTYGMTWKNPEDIIPCEIHHKKTYVIPLTQLIKIVKFIETV